MQELSFAEGRDTALFFLDRECYIFYISDRIALPHAGGWSNGKAADSDSAYRGSSPCPPATQILALIVNSISAFLFCVQFWSTPGQPFFLSCRFFRSIQPQHCHMPPIGTAGQVRCRLSCFVSGNKKARSFWDRAFLVKNLPSQASSKSNLSGSFRLNGTILARG